MEVYYSVVSDQPPEVITGENSKNTTINGTGSISGKEKPILNKIEKGEFLIKDR